MKRILVLFVCMTFVLLCGCYDANDAPETAYLISLGIDKGENGYLYTFQLASPSDKKEGEDGKTVKNVVIGAKDFYTARNMFSNYLSKRLNMSHLKMIVCSKEIAESSFLEHSQLFAREREVRPGTYLATASGSAESFLKAVNPMLEGNTAKYYELINTDKSMFYAPRKTLGEFLSDVETLDKSGVLPVARVSGFEKSDEIRNEQSEKGEPVKAGIFRVSDSKTELFGMGIFKKGRLIGISDGNDALMYNILSGFSKNFDMSIVSPYDENKTLSFKVSLNDKPKISVSAEGKIKINVVVSGELEYIGKPDENDIKKIASTSIEKALRDFLEKTSRVYGTDVLKIGNQIKKNYLTQKDFENIRWEEKYPKAEFFVSVLFE